MYDRVLLSTTSESPLLTTWWQGSPAPSAVRPLDLVEHDDAAVVGVTEPAVRAELAVAVVPCWLVGAVSVAAADRSAPAGRTAPFRAAAGVGWIRMSANEGESVTFRVYVGL